MTPEQIQELRELARQVSTRGHTYSEEEVATALRACADDKERALAGITDEVVERATAVANRTGAMSWNGSMRVAAMRAALQSAALALRPDAKELEHLRAFAKDIMRSWPEGGVDGGELQDAALRHGLLEPAEPTQEERDEWGLCDTDDFYRRTALLTADLSRATGDGNGR